MLLSCTCDVENGLRYKFWFHIIELVVNIKSFLIYTYGNIGQHPNNNACALVLVGHGWTCYKM